jgi:hypothetical protein
MPEDPLGPILRMEFPVAPHAVARPVVDAAGTGYSHPLLTHLVPANYTSRLDFDCVPVPPAEGDA